MTLSRRTLLRTAGTAGLVLSPLGRRGQVLHAARAFAHTPA